MPTYSATYDNYDNALEGSTHLAEDGYPAVSPTGFGEIRLYIDRTYSCTGYIYGIHRWLGNADIQWHFHTEDFTQDGLDIEMGICGFNEKSRPYTIDVLYVNATTLRVTFQGGTSEEFTIGTPFSVRFTQQGNTNLVDVYFRLNNDAYTHKTTVTIADITNPEGWKLIWYLNHASTSAQPILGLAGMDITADYTSHTGLDNWPTVIDSSLYPMGCMGFSGHLEIPEDTYDYEVNYGLPFPADEWTEATNGTPYVKEDRSVLRLPIDAANWSSYSYSDDYFIYGDIVSVTRFNIQSFGYNVYFKTTLRSKGNSSHYIEYMVYHDGASRTCRFTITKVNSSGSTFINSTYVDVPYGITLEMKIIEHPDYSVSFYYRAVPYDWVLIGTSSLHLVQTFSGGVNVTHTLYCYSNVHPYDSTVELIDYKVNSRYNLYQLNWFGDISNAIIENIQGELISGWLTYISYNWTNTPDRNLNTLDFNLPIPTYTLSSGSIRFTSTDVTDLQFFAHIENNFVIDFEPVYMFPPNSLQPYNGFRFYVNDIECWIGLHWDGTNDRAGFAVDGVWYYHSDTSWGYNYINRFIVSLTGNHLVVSIKQSAAAAEIVYEDTDFLGSPASYDVRDITYVRSSGTAAEYGYFQSINILGVGQLPIDLTGSLETSIDMWLELLARLSPPVLADPGFFFHRTQLTGGSDSALDSLDPTNLEGTGQQLTTSSACIVITDTDDILVYKAYNDGPVVESVPDIIVPNNNPGTWYWKAISCRQFRPAFMLTQDDIQDPDLYPFPWEYFNDYGLQKAYDETTTLATDIGTARQADGAGYRLFNGSGLQDRIALWFVPNLTMILNPTDP